MKSSSLPGQSDPAMPAPDAAPSGPLSVGPLDPARFARYGQVIEATGLEGRLINDGTTSRLDALAMVTTYPLEAHAVISLFIARRRLSPLPIRTLERHPFGSQAFMPLGETDYLVVVAPDLDGEPGEPEAFHARSDQGINFAAGTWHHPLIALHEGSRFLVVDREKADDNLELRDLAHPRLLAWKSD